MYHKRYLEEKIKQSALYFKVILLTGARQVGKSTLLNHVFPNAKSFVFDPVQDLYNVKQDPLLFLNNFKTPIILDEIQYVTEILPVLKRKVDESEEKGQYFLTGSQNINMLKNVSESLAGRVCILNLNTMTLNESYDLAKNNNLNSVWIKKYIDSPYDLQKNLNNNLLDKDSLFDVLWQGNFPGALGFPNNLRVQYFSSYIQTYIERDIRLMEDIRDLNLFDRFLGLIANLTAQEINFQQLGREIGIAGQTAHRWINLLNNTYQWLEIWPYSGNTIKRITKKRKGYLTDTGLICYLQRISSPEALARHPLLGSIFETFVVNNIYALCNCLDISVNFYHWRSDGGAEVDLILERDGVFYPIEIKSKSNLNKHDARGLRAFKETYKNNKIMPGLIIYAGRECYWLNEDVIALPWNAI